MNATAPAPAGASPALAAFLRGSGRRALLFAQLQAGDAVRGDAAAIASLPRFAESAAALPMAQWPRRFWSGLLAEPGLRPGPEATWPPAFAALADVGPGSRAALLLWLVAGLGEEDAAAALDVGVPAWRMALQRAAPVDASGQIDTAAWRALEAEVRDSLRALSPARTEAWDAACARVASPSAPAPVRHVPAPALHPGQRRRWWLPAVAVCGLVLAAVFLLPWRQLLDGDKAPAEPGAPPAVERSELADGDGPAPFDAGERSALLLHPDFELLAAGGDTPLLRNLAFNAWYAAQRGDAAPDDKGGADAD